MFSQIEIVGILGAGKDAERFKITARTSEMGFVGRHLKTFLQNVFDILAWSVGCESSFVMFQTKFVMKIFNVFLFMLK